MLTVPFHGEGDSRYQGQARPTLVVEVAGLQIVSQFTGMFEIVPVGTVIEHVPHQVDRLFIILVAPTLGGGNMAQKAQAVAEVLPVLIVEISLQLVCLFLRQVLVDGELAALQCFCEDEDSFLRHPSQLPHLLLTEKEPPAI